MNMNELMSDINLAWLDVYIWNMYYRNSAYMIKLFEMSIILGLCHGMWQEGGYVFEVWEFE